MQNVFNQSARRGAAEALLKEWEMEYSVGPDGVIALDGDFHTNGVRSSTSGRTQALAEKMFGSKDALIFLNMAEFSEAHQVMMLVGVPPGYVGFGEERGTLTDRLRQNPCCLLVLDEFDKAHPKAREMLKKAFADKKITDSQGREISLENVVVLTTVGRPSAQVKEERQSRMATELAIRATEGIPNPVKIYRPLRFRVAGLATFQG
ncbi:MAG: AAA family ATPase [Alphaproteobacteria bacterium]